MKTILALMAAFAGAPAAGQMAEANTRAALARIAALNPRVNAVLAVDPTAIDQAHGLDRGAVRGALFGMPILIKDNIDTKGPLPTTAGSLALRNNVTGRDAPVVARLRAAGAVILGKTNLSEWANIRGDASISGWSALGGQVRNPHALNRSPCGSSSGSGAAVAAGMVDAAVGTETDGSVTCPAAVNGIVGFKPTVGLVSRTHVVPISHSQDTPGPMTKDVRTAALLLNAMAGSDAADPATVEADRRRVDYVAALKPDALRGVRIGVLRLATGWSVPVDAVFERALAVLKAQGAVLVDVKDAPKDQDKLGEAEFRVLLSELKTDLDAYLATVPPSVKVRSLADAIAFNAANPRELALFGQETFVAAQATKGAADPDYLAARTLSLRLAGVQGIDALLIAANAVALVQPTTSPAWMIDAVLGDQSPDRGSAGSMAAVAGYPHLTVPMGAVQGLPVGLSFIGTKWDDARMLALGHAYEQAARVRVVPTFAASVEVMPGVAGLLAPVK